MPTQEGSGAIQDHVEFSRCTGCQVQDHPVSQAHTPPPHSPSWPGLGHRHRGEEGQWPGTPLTGGRSPADSNFVLGNAQVAGLFPVVYCSDGFCDLTGFSRAEVMQRGCACSFLYGPDTSELVRQQIRKALDEHKEFKAELILYRKSGEGHWAGYPPSTFPSPGHQFPVSPRLLLQPTSCPHLWPRAPHSCSSPSLRCTTGQTSWGPVCSPQPSHPIYQASASGDMNCSRSRL